MPPRYLIEDVPMGLVPVSALDQKVGVSTPMVDTLIQMTSVSKGVDYRAEGRASDKLGLADHVVNAILHLVNEE